MKIAFLLHSAFGIGGTIRTVLTQAEALASRHEVEVVSVFRPRDLPKLGLAPTVALSALVDLRAPAPSTLGEGGRRLHESDPRAGEPPQIYPRGEARAGQYSRLTDDRIARFLSRTDADVVVTTRAGLNVAAVRLAPDRLPIVGQEHLPFDVYKEPLLSALYETYPRLAALATVTEADARAYRAWLPSNGPLLRAIPNPVPAPGLVAERAPSRIVMAAGRLAPSKRFDILIDAFARLGSDFPDWQLRIHGGGGLKETLRRQVHSLGLTDRAFLMGAHPRLEESWALGSLAAQTSRSEAFGLTIAEAMRCGLPVVSTDCPHGPAEIIRHGEDGLLVENRSVAAVAEGLAQLMGDDRRRRDMAEAARSNAARFDPGEVALRHEELLREVTSTPAPAPASALPLPHDPPECRAVTTEAGHVELEFAKPPESVLLDKSGEQAFSVSADDRSRFVVTPERFARSGQWALYRIDGAQASPVADVQIDLRAHRGGQPQGGRLDICLPVRDSFENLSLRVRRVEAGAEVRAVKVTSRAIAITARLPEPLGAVRARLHLTLRGADTVVLHRRCRIAADGTLEAVVKAGELADRCERTGVWDLSVHTGDGRRYVLSRYLAGVAEHGPLVAYPEARVNRRGGPAAVTPYYTRNTGALAIRIHEAPPAPEPPRGGLARTIRAFGSRLPARVRSPLLRRLPATLRKRLHVAVSLGEGR